MFLTPAGEPVWGGTYFPKVSRYGRPAFTDVLREVARLFQEEPEKIEQNRRALMQRLAEKARPVNRVVIGLHELDNIAKRAAGVMDPVHGGMQGAPKFPNAALFELIWRAGLRSGDNRYFTLVEITLDHICQGGIYDHLGGGFARYSVDDRWLVPHFEKMLYDNAQLLELLALAHLRTSQPLYRQRAVETVEWLTREMTRPEGAFAASLDADSEGEEGRFYVWSHDEIFRVLGPKDGALFAATYDVTLDGNFEGHNILNRLKGPTHGADDEARLGAMRAALLQERGKRIRPGLDDKVLADWNGLMIAALANAGALLDEPLWIIQARRAFRFIVDSMTRGDRLGHSWRDGRLLFPGLASDFANMIRAALTLFEVTADPSYLDQAIAWQRSLDRHYSNAATGGYYLTADDAEGLVVRPNSTMDEATPNPNAIAAQNVIRLATLAGDDAWREAADRLFDRSLPIASENLFGHMALLNALDLKLHSVDIIITGSGARADALAHVARQMPFVERTVLRVDRPDRLSASHPARDKITAHPEGAAFVCAGERCSLPVMDVAGLRNAYAALRG